MTAQKDRAVITNKKIGNGAEIDPEFRDAVVIYFEQGEIFLQHKKGVDPSNADQLIALCLAQLNQC